MNGSPVVFVVGAYGLLGGTLCEQLTRAGFAVLRQGRGAAAEVSLNPLDSTRLIQTVRDCDPDVVINLCAMTNVDACERDPETAERVNVGVAASLVDAISGSERALIQVSTDQVYSGDGPHRESDTAPLNEYGRTKLLADEAVAAAGGMSLRCNFAGPSRTAGRRSFSDWVIARCRSGRPFSLFEDVLFSPLELSDLCRVIVDCVESPLPGVFNAGSRGGVSKAGFALALAAQLGLDASKAEIASVRGMGLDAPRPSDMRMDCSRLEARGIRLPTIGETVRRTADAHAAAGLTE